MEEGELELGHNANAAASAAAAAGGGADELYNALHQRLVASGEWQRLLVLVRRMLDECGWAASFQSHATAKAKQQPTLDVPSLIDALTPHAKDTLPPHVRTHLLEKLRDFLDRNLEDA